LLKAFPNDGFLGEEFGDQPGTSGFRWIVDPIDGTRSFRPQHSDLGHADRPGVSRRTNRGQLRISRRWAA